MKEGTRFRGHPDDPILIDPKQKRSHMHREQAGL